MRKTYKKGLRAAARSRRMSAQTKPDSEPLLRVFNLAENNPDRGGGILYCLRYSSDNLREHQKVLIAAFQTLRIDVEEHEDGITIKPAKGWDPGDTDRLMLLLEELSVVNEALEYVDAGLGDLKGLEGLKNKLLSTVIQLVDNWHTDNVKAYDLVTIAIPQLVNELRYADRRHDVLTDEDRGHLEEIDSFASRWEKHMNRRTVVFGASPTR